MRGAGGPPGTPGRRGRFSYEEEGGGSLLDTLDRQRRLLLLPREQKALPRLKEGSGIIEGMASYLGRDGAGGAREDGGVITPRPR